MKSAFYALFIGLSLCCYAQNSLDLFTVSFRHGFSRPTNEVVGNASENVGLVNLKVPIRLSKTSIWYNDLTYQASTVDYSSDFPNTIDPTNLHGFIFQSGLVRKLDEKSAFQLLAVPRLMTDLNNVTINHFQFGGIGLYERKFSESLTMRYGLMYNQELFGDMFVPLVYLNWSLTPKWSVKGLFPIFTKITYQSSEKLALGLSHFGMITSFQVGDPFYNQDYIERKSIDLTLFGRYKLAGNFHLEMRAGYALGRSYYQYAKGDEVDFRVAIFSVGDNRTQKNVSFNPGSIIDFRMVYNLPLD
ncbi:MAG: hypothetical protein JXR03_19530 [Cyclobacteriaceae bacterium]